MQDEKFWSQCINILRKRQIFNKEIWAYSMKHRSDI